MLSFSDSIKPICLPTRGYSLVDTITPKCIITAWGAQVDQLNTSSLASLQVKIISISHKCSSTRFKNSKICSKSDTWACEVSYLQWFWRCGGQSLRGQKVCPYNGRTTVFY